jgi:hypothetical protein
MRSFFTHLVSSDPTDGDGNLKRANQYIASGTLSGSFVSNPINLGHIVVWSVSCVLTGPPQPNLALTGSFSVECSNDIGDDRYGGNIRSTSWQQVTGSGFSCPATGSANLTLNFAEIGYHWARCRWTHGAGTGSIDIFATGKGTT